MSAASPLVSASLNATHASDFEPVSGFPIARNNSSIVACDQSRGVATGEGAVDCGVADGGAVGGGGAAEDGTAGDGRVVTGVVAGPPVQAAIARQRETHAAASRR
jgi:hypothetical protein